VPARLSLTADKAVIVGTDARDDVHLLVTVQNAEGKPISNSPPVTFTIASGPGEFPTGRTITFDGGTDIPIRDGLAAIEFRSYYGGETVIRATSPGLKEAVLTITTQGEPKFIPGKTPVVPNRPYARYVVRAETTPAAAADQQDIAGNRPTGASSEAPGHNGSRALDGDLATYWAATDNQSGAWWQLDLEQPHTITSVQTTFPTSGNYRYRLEGSLDGKTWTLLVDRSQTKLTDKVRTDPIPANQHWQMVRLTFTGLPAGQPAAIADVKMEGKHWP
jgi:hypothetical protein